MTPGIDSVGIVVGNPKPRSRTREVAEAVAAAAGGCRRARRRRTGRRRSRRVRATALRLVLDAGEERGGRGSPRCPLVVVASPTYKASYTGLLKSFLDWFSTTGLQGATVIPLMVGAGPQHALAVEVHLRPVLVEIGATLPTRGLYVTEAQLVVLPDVIGEWLAEAAPGLRASLGLGPR